MDRQNAFTLHVTDWRNSDFWQVLAEYSEEDVLFDVQPDFKTDGVFWFEDTPKELFKYSDCFNWLSGSVKLWIKGEELERLTRLNYRTPVYVGEGEEMVLDHYEYIPIDNITDIPPIVEEEEE